MTRIPASNAPPVAPGAGTLLCRKLHSQSASCAAPGKVAGSPGRCASLRTFRSQVTPSIDAWFTVLR
jgi:hypothetical protein